MHRHHGHAPSENGAVSVKVLTVDQIRLSTKLLHLRNSLLIVYEDNSTCFTRRKRIIVVWAHSWHLGRLPHAFDADVWSLLHFQILLDMQHYSHKEQRVSPIIISVSHLQLYGTAVWFTMWPVWGRCSRCVVYTDPLQNTYPDPYLCMLTMTFLP